MSSANAKIKAGAPETIVDQLVADVAAASGKPAHAAEILRDENGKLVNVVVGILSNPSEVDQSAVADILNDNPGVAIARVYPYDVSADYDNSLPANGTIFTLPDQYEAGDETVIELLPPAQGNIAADLSVSDAVDALGGSGKAMQQQFSAETETFYFSRHQQRPQFTTIPKAMEYSGVCKVKDESGAIGDVNNEWVCQLIGSSTAVNTRAWIYTGAPWYDPTGTANWKMAIGTPGNFQTSVVDTGVPRTSFLDFKFTIDQLGVARLEANSGASVVFNNPGFASPLNHNDVEHRQTHNFSAASARTIDPLILDEIVWKILG